MLALVGVVKVMIVITCQAGAMTGDTGNGKQQEKKRKDTLGGGKQGVVEQMKDRRLQAQFIDMFLISGSLLELTSLLNEFPRRLQVTNVRNTITDSLEVINR